MAERRVKGEVAQLAIPSVMVAAAALIVWLTAFTDVKDEPVQQPEPVGLEARAAGQISGVKAAVIAIDLARNAVENRSSGDDGLLAGPPERVYARYEPLGTASSWTVVIQGPIRSRPNTEEEFRIEEGMIVIELSAFTGEVSGHFSAGRAFLFPASGSGFLTSLGISSAGLIEVPIDLVWPPRPA